MIYNQKILIKKLTIQLQKGTAQVGAGQVGATE